MKNFLGCLLGLLAIALAPIWMPLLMFEWAFIPNELLMRRRMKKKMRYIRLEEISDGGFFIVDWPTFNWGISRIWWTPEDVTKLSTVLPSERDLRYVTTHKIHEDGGSVVMHAVRGQEENTAEFSWSIFDRWCTERYVSEQTGSAMLVAVWHAHNRQAFLQKKFPHSRFISCYSGGMHLEAFYKSTKSSP